MERFSNLPPPVQWLLGVTGIGALVGTGLMMGSGKWIFLAALVVLLLLLVGGFLLYRAWQRKKQSSQFLGDISQHSTASPRSISDPGQRARLDDLRKKFQEGIDAYRSRGKDIYKLPWYAIVGEPGSGKTEAVRHCNIGFPPGMQDEFQGVGGTINMNWWFANNAVLLDTAGRLMFEDVKPGETSEWREFLNLLKKNRPNCPINGLLLVIPSDSLITDSGDAIQKKAGKIAQQLDVIQRVLDVRFPVFVVVTKCDKINGFREFFDGLSDPQVQHQMMGWSNPEPLDTPFQPDKVVQHLEKVVQRLRRRRLGLMRDPIPEIPGTRRTDEVDSLYALPHSLSLLGSRLRRYLETIFVAGEWSAKPLFLRGIYFSSSMREGSALDQDLAEAIGVSVDALPEGKDWERERAFFLRDLFLEKAFREKDLVTRATNTNKMLRRRQVLLFGCGFAALALFVGLAWMGMSELNSTVGIKSDLWTKIMNVGWNNKIWKQAIVTADGEYRDQVKFEGEVPMSQGKFYNKLIDLVQHPLRDNWKFPGLASQYNRESTNAERIVFETGVVKPLVEAARRKIIRSTGAAGADPAQTTALVDLIQLESDILERGFNPNATRLQLDVAGAQKRLGDFLVCATGTPIVPDTNIVTAMVWTYSDTGPARGAWPPAWLSGATSTTNNLDNNPAIRAGLDNFIAAATNDIRSKVDTWQQTSALSTALQQFKTDEDALFDAVSTANMDQIKQAADKLEATKKVVDLQSEAIAKSPLFKGSLYATYQEFRGQVVTNATMAFDNVKKANDAARADHKDCPLFADISGKLAGVQQALARELDKFDTSADTNKMQEMDRDYLAKSSAGPRNYAQRWELYEAAMKPASKFQPDTMIGSRDDQLQSFVAEQITPLAQKISAFAGPRADRVAKIGGFFLHTAELEQREIFMTLYLQQAASAMNAEIGFPLSKRRDKTLSLNDVNKASKLLAQLNYDIPRLSALATNAPFNNDADAQKKWDEHADRVRALNTIAASVTDDTGQPITCTVSLVAMSTSPRDDRDRWRGRWRDVLLAGSSSKKTRTNLPDDATLGDVGADQKLELQLFTDDGQMKKYPTDDPSGDWGVLRVLHTDPAVRKDPTTWLVDLPIDPSDGQGAIRLKLKFSHSLPDLDHWPR